MLEGSARHDPIFQQTHADSGQNLNPLSSKHIHLVPPFIIAPLLKSEEDVSSVHNFDSRPLFSVRKRNT